MANENAIDRGNVRPICVASTGDSFCKSLAECEEEIWQKSERGRPAAASESNCFRNAQWSPDGTTLITESEDWRLRTFVLPSDLLEPSDNPRSLTAYSTAQPIHSYASAVYPFYSLQDTSTTLVLQSQHDLPIRLINALSLSFTHASYPYVHPTTEAFICPSSLLFTQAGTHFVAGGKECLAVFDISRNGEGPVTRFATRVSKNTRRLYGESSVGLGGIVSALSLNLDDVLAAGTTRGQIGLWEAGGLGESVASFSIDDKGTELGGNGIMQLAWSTCGRYLFAAERQSDALQVYDIRGTSRRLCWLRGRRAMTTQKLGFDLLQSRAGSIDVWAGGCDGMVRSWSDITSREGALEADFAYQAHKDAVTSTTFHPCGTLLATASGQRFSPQDLAGIDGSSESGFPSSEDNDDIPASCSPKSARHPRRQPDNTVKVWDLRSHLHDPDLEDNLGHVSRPEG